MTTPGKRTTFSVDETVEQILGKSSPRPVPSIDETEEVRRHVHVAWQKVARKRRNRRHWKSFAIAASVLIAVFATFNAFRINGIAETQVASIGKSFGSIYVLGENAEMLARSDLKTVVAGQTLITDDASGVSLAWDGGGSLRIDADTRVEFVTRDSIYLHSGRVYFDSDPNMLAGRKTAPLVAAFTILTDHGPVSHVGTQYMTRVDANSLTVSVREGDVELGTRSGTVAASGGQQLQLRGNSNASIVNIKTYGGNWQWAEQLSPRLDAEGRSVHEFLGWVSHETGLGLRFKNDVVEKHAKDEELRGDVNTDPMGELRAWMLTVDLEWRIENGVIHIDAVDRQTEQ